MSEAQLSSISKQIADFSGRFETRLADRFTAQDARFEQRLKAQDEKFERRFDTIDGQPDTQDKRFDDNRRSARQPCGCT